MSVVRRPRCESCAHWTQDDGGRPVEPLTVPYTPDESWDIRRRERNADIGECTAVAFVPDVEADAPVPLAMVQDGSDYRASLFTRRDFGCVMHRPAEDAP